MSNSDHEMFLQYREYKRNIFASTREQKRAKEGETG